MSLMQVFVVTFLTSVVLILGAAWLTGRSEDRAESRVDRLADPVPMPGELSVGGLFPVDTGPLFIMSEHAAALADLEREVKQRIADAEERIPPQWR